MSYENDLIEQRKQKDVFFKNSNHSPLTTGQQ